jgi:hypothetical protein
MEDGNHYAYDGTNYYTNGEISGSFTVRATATTIGSGFTGTIGSVRHYNVALTGDEVLQLYRDGQRFPKQIKVSQPIDRIPDNADQSLVGAWLNKSVSNSAKDYSVNGHDGTATDVVWNKIGGTFNGSSSIITIPDDNSLDITNAITIRCLIKPGATSEIFGRYLAKVNAYLLGQQGSDETNIRWECVGGDVLDSGVGTINVGEYNHVVATYDKDAGADNKKIYINGELIASKTLTDPIGTSANALTLGDIFGGGQAYQGNLEEVEIYNEAKTADWVKYQYQQGVPDNSLVLSILDGTEDLSRYKNTLTNTDTTVGNRMIFNGSTSYLDKSISDWRSSDSLGTVSCWVKFNSLPGGGTFKTIFSSADFATSSYYINFATNGNNIAITQKNNDTTDNIRGNTTLSVGQWYFLTWCSGGSAYKFYVNGGEETLTVVGGANNGDWFADTDNRDNINIGTLQRNGGTESFSNAEMSDLNVSSRQLSADEIKSEYLRTRKYY